MTVVSISLQRSFDVSDGHGRCRLVELKVLIFTKSLVRVTYWLRSLNQSLISNSNPKMCMVNMWYWQSFAVTKLRYGIFLIIINELRGDISTLLFFCFVYFFFNFSLAPPIGVLTESQGSKNELTRALSIANMSDASMGRFSAPLDTRKISKKTE